MGNAITLAEVAWFTSVWLAHGLTQPCNKLSEKKGQCCSLVALAFVQAQVFSDFGFFCPFLSNPVSFSIENLNFIGYKKLFSLKPDK